MEFQWVTLLEYGVLALVVYLFVLIWRPRFRLSDQSRRSVSSAYYLFAEEYVSPFFSLFPQY